MTLNLLRTEAAALRSPRLLACFLSLLCVSSALAADPPPTNSPFQIVKSFPVSESTWAEKVGDLYLVAAQRSVLVYRKTGPGEADYQEVNRLFPGLDGTIENCAIAHGRLYVPASTLGLLAYRVAELDQSGLQPELRSTGAKSVGAVSVAGGRVYAKYRNSAEGGFGVFDAETLALLGEGLPGVPLYGLSAVTSNVVYASSITNYGQMLVVNAQDVANIQLARRVTNSPYATFYRWPATTIGTNLYLAEGNGGVGVYNITDPLNPVLRYRHAAIGAAVAGRNQPGSVKAFATDGAYGFLVADQYVKTAQILSSSMQTLTTNHTSVLNGGGLLHPQGVFLRDGALGVPTTMEGVRFYSVTNPTVWSLLANVDLPSRHEGLAKHGRMVYVTTDIDGVWQLDWEAAGGPKASRRIPLKGLSEDLTLRGSYVYVANGIGLATIDVSDPANPHEVHYWDFPYPGGTPDINQGWVEGVDLVDDILYAALGPAGFGTFSLANPAQPVLMKKMLAGTSPWGNDVSVHGGRKLLAFSGKTRIVLMNVADPANPTLVSDVAVPNGKSTMGNAFSPDGNHLVVVGGGQFAVYSITNAASPQLLQTFSGHGTESALFYKNYLLVSGYGSGTAVYRIGANPAGLTRIQTLPTYFYNSKYWVEGDRLFTNSEGVDEFRLVPRLSASRSGDAVSIDWESVGQLQAAPAADGPWATISNAINPHVSGDGSTEFFRVKVQ
jgi:hypothetical protein